MLPGVFALLSVRSSTSSVLDLIVLLFVAFTLIMSEIVCSTKILMSNGTPAGSKVYFCNLNEQEFRSCLDDVDETEDRVNEDDEEDHPWDETPGFTLPELGTGYPTCVPKTDPKSTQNLEKSSGNLYKPTRRSQNGSEARKHASGY